MRFHYTIALVTLLCTSAPRPHSLYAQAESPYFASHPCLSPNGETLVFAYNGDLWRVPAAGGTALRVTALDGRESHPIISPDGKWLAFSSAQSGNNDVYVTPLNGGEIRRLTYHAANDRAQHWSWDGKQIYFESDRYNRGTTYTVSPDGGTPSRVFDHYFNTIHNVVPHPKNGTLFFNESWESDRFTNRKGYKGPFNPEIKVYSPKREAVEQLTDYEGKDLWPMVDRKGNVFFCSDRGNEEYNLFSLDGKKAKRLTEFPTAVFNPRISADGSAIAFERDYQIHVYDVRTGKVNTPKIQLSNYAGLQRTADYTTHKKISYFDVAPDAKKLAFVSRGELFVSDIGGKFIRQLDSGPGAVAEVKWLKDSKNLVFTQTDGGYMNLFTISADATGEARQLTRDRRTARGLEIAPDSTHMAYLSGRDELRVMNLEDFSEETVATDEIWAFQNDLPRWSPDGRYLLFAAYRNFEKDLLLVDTENDNRVTNLTNTGVSENEAVWSPDGKYIYFTSSRYAPNYPRGGGGRQLFRVPLVKIQQPFRATKFDELFAENAKEKKDSVVVELDLSDLMERVRRVGPGAGNQSGPAVVESGEKTVVVYGSNHEGQSGFYKTTFADFEKPKTEKIKGSGVGNATDLVTRKGKHYLMGNGQVMELKIGPGKLEPIETKHTFRRALRPEFEQMFYETWANLAENFYNDDFHGKDWAALRDRYAAYLPHLTDRADLRRLTNDLLGELNTSHFGFYSSGDEEKTKQRTRSLSLGVEFDSENPYVIKRILTDGPADRHAVDLRPGDALVSVNGEDLDAARNRESYLAGPSLPDEVTLVVRRADGGELDTVRLHPESYRSEQTYRYDEWVDDNQRRVDEQTDKRVAYIHMKNMGGGELNRFLREMVGETYAREALILDLRYNTGGNVHDDVLRFLGREPYATWRYRGGADAPQPNFAPRAKPIVLLINQQSLSDAEVTAEGFKQLKLGTVVGTPTYRWIIFTSGKGLVDGSFYRLPSWGVYGLDGRNLEKTGVEPDVRIDNTAADRQAGRDPQLDKAIELVLKDLR